MIHEWRFPIVQYRVIDGDSIELTVDTGFRSRHTDNCRISGIDAPEVHTVSGMLVKRLVEEWLDRRSQLMFWCHDHSDKYGRPLGEIYSGLDDSEHLGHWLRNVGVAKAYDGSKREWTQTELTLVELKCRELLATDD